MHRLPCLFVLVLVFSSQLLFADHRQRESQAKALVQRALEAEIAGDTEAREAAIGEALRIHPDYAPARNLQGQIKLRSRWLDVEDYEVIVRRDPKLARYEELRYQLASHRQRNLYLARYCQAYNLPDQARFHWREVLKGSQNRAEAIQALKLQSYRGELVTEAQMKELLEVEELTAKVIPKLKRLVRSIQAQDDRADWSLAELRKFNDPRLLGLLEEHVAPISGDFAMEVVKILRRYDTPFATIALIRHAVFSPHEKVRTHAAASLVAQPKLQVVPWLLNAFATPIEMKTRETFNTTGPAVETTFAFERPDYVVVHTVSIRTDMLPSQVREAHQFHDWVANEVVDKQAQVEQFNASIEGRNARIADILESITGRAVGETPQQWWEWWTDYNDYEYASVKPRYERAERFRYRFYRPPGECFLPGTLVWTETGKRAIESIEPGDLILTRDVETGELSYQVVQNRTNREVEETVRLRVAGEDILSTRGHPIWVVGKGWQMAKNIRAGDYLHGIRGRLKVEAVSKGPPSPVYNLEVAVNQNYFVGKSGFLAHDVTLRGANRQLAPGQEPMTPSLSTR